MRQFSVGDAQAESALINDTVSGVDVARLARLDLRKYPGGAEHGLTDEEWQSLVNLIHGAQGMLDTLRYLAKALKEEDLIGYANRAKRAIKKATTC